MGKWSRGVRNGKGQNRRMKGQGWMRERPRLSIDQIPVSPSETSRLEEVDRIIESNVLPEGEELIYHLTTPKKWKSIRLGKGLLGSGVGGYGNPKVYSEPGYLYLVDSELESLWNGISTNMICDDHVEMYDRTGFYYVVIGIRKSYFTDQDLELLQEDVPEILSHFFVKVELSQGVIPHEELHFIGEYITDPWMWETKTRWELGLVITGNPSIEKLQFSSGTTSFLYGNDEPGVVYEDRFKKTTQEGFRRFKKNWKKGSRYCPRWDKWDGVNEITNEVSLIDDKSSSSVSSSLKSEYSDRVRSEFRNWRTNGRFDPPENVYS